MHVDNRSVGETNMNDHSSRSHTIFTLTIESRLRDEEGGDGTVKVASLVSIVHINIRICQSHSSAATIRINTCLVIVAATTSMFEGCLSCASLSIAGKDLQNVHV